MLLEAKSNILEISHREYNQGFDGNQTSMRGTCSNAGIFTLFPPEVADRGRDVLPELQLPRHVEGGRAIARRVDERACAREVALEAVDPDLREDVAALEQSAKGSGVGTLSKSNRIQADANGTKRKFSFSASQTDKLEVARSLDRPEKGAYI